MKHRMLLLLIPAMIILTHCNYENEEELFGENDCSTQPASLTEDVIPIININCAISGCHEPGVQAPDLTQKENIIASAPLIKTQVQTRTMPPSDTELPLSTHEIQTIVCWVDNGAQEN